MSAPRRPRNDRGAAYDLLRRMYRFLKCRVLFDTLLCPYGMVRHALLLRSGDRSKRHTYTCFLRAPAQLDALTGPVVDFLVGSDPRKNRLSILLFACSNGAEAYTIVSALLRARPDIECQVVASDLDHRLIDTSTTARYSRDDVYHSPYITDEFVRETFDLVAGAYVVKPAIRARVQFRQADVLDATVRGQFEAADLVLAQNLFFHLAPAEARTAFDNVVSLLKPRAALFIEGFDLGLREELTRERRLTPLDYRVREIYEQSRTHATLAWWTIYYGAEPYMPWRRHRAHRYGTIFLNEAEAHH